MSGIRAGYHSFWIKFCAALALVALGDALFYQMDRGGSTIGVFAGAWLVAGLAAGRAMRHDRRALICLGAAGIFAAALVLDSSLLAWVLFWTTLSIAALLSGTAAFDDAWRWLQRLMVHGCLSMIGPAIDGFKLRRLHSFPSWQHGMRGLLPILVLPLIGSAVILTLFSAANPVIGDMLATAVARDFGEEAIRQGADVWLPEPVVEMRLRSDRYDQELTLLHFMGRGPWAHEEELREDSFDRFHQGDNAPP